MSNVDDIKKTVKTGKGKSAIDGLFGAEEEEKEENETTVQEAVEVEIAAGKDGKGDKGMEMLVEELNEILNKEEPKKTAKPDMVGIYFDADVKKALDKYQKDNGRGAKSDLINRLARFALTKKGYLK